MTVCSRSFVALGFLLFSTSVFAQSNTYTSSAEFLAQVRPGYFLNNFTGANSSTPSFTGGSAPFSYTISPEDALYTGNGQFMGNSFGNEDLVITFTSGSPTAIGGEFWVSNFSDAFQSVPLMISLSDGTSVTYTPSAINEFRGFTSVTPITSLTLSRRGVGLFNNMDNLIVGHSIAVPEPASVAFVGLGVFSLSLSRGRNRVFGGSRLRRKRGAGQ